MASAPRPRRDARPRVEDAALHLAAGDRVKGKGPDGSVSRVSDRRAAAAPTPIGCSPRGGGPASSRRRGRRRRGRRRPARSARRRWRVSDQVTSWPDFEQPRRAAARPSHRRGSRARRRGARSRRPESRGSRAASAAPRWRCCRSPGRRRRSATSEGISGSAQGSSMQNSRQISLVGCGPRQVGSHEGRDRRKVRPAECANMRHVNEKLAPPSRLRPLRRRPTASPRGPPPRSATSAAAERSSPSPAASIPASSPRSASAPSAPSTSSACGCPSATSAPAPRDLGLELARAARHADRGAADHRRPRGARLLPPARRGDPRRLPRLRAELEAQARPLAAERRDDRLLARRRAPRRHRRSRSGCRPSAYRLLLAATNMKQRVRKLRRVHLGRPARLRGRSGRPNLLEYDQGFFVKGGDGLADVKPIAGLYKTPGLRARRELGLPEAIAKRAPDDRDLQPRPDPGGVLLRLPARADGRAAVGPRRRASRRREIAAQMGLEEAEVDAAYGEIDRRREATRYLHAPAVIVEPRS